MPIAEHGGDVMAAVPPDLDVALFFPGIGNGKFVTIRLVDFVQTDGADAGARCRWFGSQLARFRTLVVGS